MNKKITMSELLVLVKDGKAPKKIKYRNMVYHINYDEGDYESDIKLYRYSVYEEPYYLFGEIDIFKCLNTEVEILEEEKKITPTDFENLGYALGSIQKYINKGYDKAIEEKKIPEKLELIENGDFVEIPDSKDLMNKINEIIDYLDYLKSKGE